MIDISKYIGKNITVKKIVCILDRQGKVIQSIEMTPDISVIKAGVGVFDAESLSQLEFQEDEKIIEVKIGEKNSKRKSWEPWELNMIRGGVEAGRKPQELQIDLQLRNSIRTVEAVAVAMTKIRQEGKAKTKDK